MPIQNTIQTIQSFHRSLNLGLEAPDEAPPLLVLEKLPAIITRVGPYLGERWTLGSIRFEREIELHLFYRPLGGVSPADEIAMVDLADQIIRAWLNPTSPFRVAQVRCDGVRYDLVAGDKAYLGTIIHLVVSEED